MIQQIGSTDIIDSGFAINVTITFKASYDDRIRILDLIRDNKLIDKLTKEE